jgi:DNA (cytosine-5)-methyltransferase 3A
MGNTETHLKIFDKNEFNVLSLFDGISCGQIALNKAGIKYNKYLSSEIEKPSIKVTQYNYPDTLQLGDITELKGDNLPKISLLMGGSPCQSFSPAVSSNTGFDGKSKLFFEFTNYFLNLLDY